MRRQQRRFLALVSACAIAAAACSGSGTLDDLAAEASTSPTSTTAPLGDSTTEGEPTWPSIPAGTAPTPDPTPLPIDNRYRIGTLDNGLTFLLRSNDSPGSSLELRLLINAGSAQQPVGDDGSAHFLEHMLFNGTSAFPGNGLTLQLQQLGLAFGPDINAYTSYDETVYFLTASTFDPAAPETAFEVLAQWASAATLDPDEVAAEVGVVRDELRQSSESVDGIVADAIEAIYTEGTAYEGHAVIGTAELVEATTAAVLRNFYDDWYRPDNMAVVVVGDMSLDDLEDLVEEHFADLEARTDDAPTHQPISADFDSQARSSVIVHPDSAVDNLSLDFPLTVWDRSTVGGERLSIVESAISSMVDGRLAEAFQRGDLVLDSSPYLGEFSINRGLRYFGTNLVANDLGVALDQYMSEILATAIGGFNDDDLDRVRERLLAGLDDEAASLATIQDRDYAFNLSDYWLEGSGLSGGGLRIVRQRDVVASLTTDELTNHWRWILQTGGPIAVAIGEDASTLPTAEELLQILAEATPSESVAGAAEIDQLMDRPTSIDPISTVTRSTRGNDVEEWTFANGVVVSFQQSDIEEGRFDVWTESNGGWSTFEPGSIGANSAIPGFAIDAVIGSGVGTIDPATLTRFLETRAIGVFAYIDESEEGFVAGGAVDDAEALFQLLHLIVTQPRVDDVAYRTAISQAETFASAAEIDVDLRANEALIALATGGDVRFSSIPTQSQIDELTPTTMLDLFLARLGKVDDMHVAIVGDLEADVALELASLYLGTLPEGPADTFVDLGTPLPTGILTTEVELSVGTADGGLLLLHTAAGNSTARNEVTSLLLQTIINTRITETIREELAISYGGFASISTLRIPSPVTTSYIQIDGDPSRLDELRAAILDTLVDLAITGPSADEFARAKSVVENQYSFVNNQTFLAVNLATTRFPDADILTPDNRFTVFGRIRISDVTQLAAALFGDGDRVEVAKVLP